MADRGTDEATAQSIRALFDLPRFVLVAVERWAGWGRLTLVPKVTRFRCPLCRTTLAEGSWRAGARCGISTSVAVTSSSECRCTACGAARAAGRRFQLRWLGRMLGAHGGWNSACSS
jgi:RNase P subunit RPR2